MYTSEPTVKKFEEFAYVLAFVRRGKSTIIREREGPLVQAIGEERLTLLEILAADNANFVSGEKIAIGKEKRDKDVSVIGKLNYEELTPESKNEIPNVLEKLIKANEQTFVAFFNDLQPITPRLHALELIPGIGKTIMRQIIRERERKPFENFEDLEKRIGIRDPAKLISKRMVEELSGSSRISIFVHH